MAALLHIDTLRQHAVPPAVLARPVLAHDIPGRLRVLLPFLRDDVPAAMALRRRLRAVDRIIDVRVNLVIGSVTVLYEVGATTRARLLETLGYPGKQQGGVTRGQAAVDILVEAVAKHLAEAAVHALFAALI